MTVTRENEVEDDTSSGLQEDIINLDTGIRKFDEARDMTPNTGTTNRDLTEKVEMCSTAGNAGGFRRQWEEKGSGSGSGSDHGSPLEPVFGGLDSTASANPTTGSASLCLPVPSDWSLCSGKRTKFFMLPNFFNHTSVEQVAAVLQEWAWLTRAGCHHAVERFLCLLLAPSCPSPAKPWHLPCRSFCHVLRDSCWASLENGRLPAECDLLPETPQEPGRPVCQSVSNWKGNPGGSGRICVVMSRQSRCSVSACVCHVKPFACFSPLGSFIAVYTSDTTWKLHLYSTVQRKANLMFADDLRRADIRFI